MANLDITVARGADWSKVMTFLDKSEVPVDLSADLASFSGEMRRQGGAIVSTFDFDFDTDGTDGKIRATLTSSETLKQARSGTYKYDIFATILGRKYRVLWGNVDFQINVTELP